MEFAFFIYQVYAINGSIQLRRYVLCKSVGGYVGNSLLRAFSLNRTILTVADSWNHIRNLKISHSTLFIPGYISDTLKTGYKT